MTNPRPLRPEPQAELCLAATVEDASLALVELTLAAASTVRSVSILQLRVLILLERHHPANLSGLADRLGLSVPSASRLVDRLVAAGLITRAPAVHSGREIDLRLSPKGRRALVRVRGRRQQAIDRVLSTMHPRDRAALARGMAAFAAAAARDSDALDALVST